MSAISSVGSSALSLVQGLAKQRIDRDGDQGQGFAARFKSRIESAAKAAGVDPSKIPTLESQIQDAIQKAQQSGAGDPRGAVQDAIDGVLKSNGIDATKFQAALKAQGPGKAHHHHAHGAKGAQPKQASPYGSDGNGDQDPLIASLQPQATGTGTLVDIAA